MFWSTLFTLSFSLFLLMDPIGNVPLFISLLKPYNPRRQRLIILRELCIALIIIMIFSFAGEGVLKLLGVSTHTTMIAGGIILFLIALKMIFPVHHDPDVDMLNRKEPFVVPLAVPLVAGPAVLAAVILYAREFPLSITLLSIVCAWVASTIILLCSSLLKRFLGWRGLTACERLMGLLLTLIAVEMFLQGLTLYRSQQS